MRKKNQFYKKTWKFKMCVKTKLFLLESKFKFIFKLVSTFFFLLKEESETFLETYKKTVLFLECILHIAAGFLLL